MMKCFNLKCSFVLFLFLTNAVRTFAYDCEIDGIFYNLDNGAHVAEVTHNGRGTYRDKKVCIPAMITVNGVTYDVHRIGDGAFYDAKLTEIEIPQSVHSIGKDAFHNSFFLGNITLPEDLDYIEERAFYGCSRLKEVQIPNSVTVIDDRAFEECTGLESIVIPQSVIYLGKLAFTCCVKLVSVTILANIQEIKPSTFSGCRSLKTIDIPSTVTSIGGSAFYRCGELQTMCIPEGVQAIDQDAFRDCVKLSTVILPSTLIKIGDYAFKNCNALSQIYCYSAIPSEIGYHTIKQTNVGLGSGGFMVKVPRKYVEGSIDVSETFTEPTVKTGVLNVPYGSIEAYRNADFWHNFVNITGFDASQSLPVSAVIMPNSVETKIYDINGVQQDAPKRGLNIINGRKVLVE